MKVIYVNNKDRDSYLPIGKSCVMALGFFDGMHLGHQQVIHNAKKAAEEKQLELACMSFFPHPKEVLIKGKKVFQYLMPMTEKQRILEKMGVTTFYIVQFDPAFASLSPKQFVQDYLLGFKVTCVVAGFDFTYGCRGEGNMDRMKDDSGNKLEVIKVDKVEFEGEKVSSTLIRRMVLSGRVDRVHRYLGKHYQIEGIMFADNGTAKVKVKPNYLLPAPGVYQVAVSNGRQIWEEKALVGYEQGTCIFPAPKTSVIDRQTIRIRWIKREQPELSIPLEHPLRKVSYQI